MASAIVREQEEREHKRAMAECLKEVSERLKVIEAKLEAVAEATGAAANIAHAARGKPSK